MPRKATVLDDGTIDVVDLGPPRSRLTKAERAEVFRASGRCYVCGDLLDPLEPFHVAKRPPHGFVVLCSPCNELRRGRTWEELREEIRSRFDDALAFVHRYASRVGVDDGAVIFSGEVIKSEEAEDVHEAEAVAP